jgi:hypothetical protein
MKPGTPLTRGQRKRLIIMTHCQFLPALLWMTIHLTNAFAYPAERRNLTPSIFTRSPVSRIAICLSYLTIA